MVQEFNTDWEFKVSGHWKHADKVGCFQELQFFYICSLKLGNSKWCMIYIMFFIFLQVPSWPTEGGITLETATERCRGMLQLSAAATTCSPLVGTLTVDVSLESCLEDIQVSGRRERRGADLTGWQSYMHQIYPHVLSLVDLQYNAPCNTMFCMNLVLACPSSVFFFFFFFFFKNWLSPQ